MSGPDRSFWSKRRVFLTGHTGFKGGWLALWLAHLGAEVRGYALPPATEPNLFTVAGVAAAAEDVRGDLNDFPALCAGAMEFRPDVVLHLAAQPLVRASYADPLETYRTNVMGTAHVLEAVRKSGSVRAVVCVTTDKVYENREWERPYTEEDALGGHDPYSSSKACAELVAAAYRRSFLSAGGCAVATARAGNVIGGGDWSTDRLLPDLLRGFSQGEVVKIRRPASVRPWQHVLEPLAGYLRLAEELFRGNAKAAAAYNFGPDAADAWPVSRIAEQVAKLWGSEARWEVDADEGMHEAGMLRLDAEKAVRELQWRPRLGIADALRWTVEWQRAELAGAPMREFTLAQIDAYEAMLAND